MENLTPVNSIERNLRVHATALVYGVKAGAGNTSGAPYYIRSAALPAQPGARVTLAPAARAWLGAAGHDLGAITTAEQLLGALDAVHLAREPFEPLPPAETLSVADTAHHIEALQELATTALERAQDHHGPKWHAIRAHVLHLTYDQSRALASKGFLSVDKPTVPELLGILASIDARNFPPEIVPLDPPEPGDGPKSYEQLVWGTPK